MYWSLQTYTCVAPGWGRAEPWCLRRRSQSNSRQRVILGKVWCNLWYLSSSYFSLFLWFCILYLQMVHAQISPATCNAVNGVMQFALLNFGCGNREGTKCAINTFYSWLYFLVIVFCICTQCALNSWGERGILGLPRCRPAVAHDQSGTRWWSLFYSLLIRFLSIFKSVVPILKLRFIICDQSRTRSFYQIFLNLIRNSISFKKHSFQSEYAPVSQII